jgi:hypothetical protein
MEDGKSKFEKTTTLQLQLLISNWLILFYLLNQGFST